MSVSASVERHRRTLRGRVAVVALVTIAGWLAVLAIGFNVVLHHQLDQQGANLARARANAAAATVRLTASGQPRQIESAGDAALDYGIWVYAGHSATQRPRASAQLQHAADLLSGVGERTVAVGDSAQLAAVPLLRRGRQVATVVASASLAPYERAERTALIGTIVISVLLVIGAYPVLRWTGRRALQQVEAMTHQAREWSAHAPTQRFGSHERYAELDDLAHTLDGVLDRLSAVLRHERQLSAELSHELRTPLATIAAEVDLLRARDPGEPAHRAIAECAATMNDIIETLLTTARAELQSDSAASDVRVVVDRLVAARTGRYEVRGATQAVVGVDETIVARLLTPLLDNAARYARTAVVVDVAVSGDRITIEIGNDGPPIPDDRLEAIFDAGTSDGGGAGLGLTLARRLARASEGDVVALSVRDSARFRVILPPG